MVRVMIIAVLTSAPNLAQSYCSDSRCGPSNDRADALPISDGILTHAQLQGVTAVMTTSATLISQSTPIGGEIAQSAKGLKLFCEFKTTKLRRLYRRHLSVRLQELCLQINDNTLHEMIEWE